MRAVCLVALVIGCADDAAGSGAGGTSSESTSSQGASSGVTQAASTTSMASTTTASTGTGGGSGYIDAETLEALAKLPDLVICEPADDPWVHQSEGVPLTRFHACVSRCTDWSQCTVETVARGRPQWELAFVVDEDGAGNGYGGTLRVTKGGDRALTVLFHKGGSGTDYVDDDVPEKVEASGGTAIEPKWVNEDDVKFGWFSRPAAASTLESNLYGIAARPAAVFKWIALNLATARFSSVGCSGGSIATYYPRHWYGLDGVLKYQLLGGGPVMSKLQAGCGSASIGLGRCTEKPGIECTDSAACGADGGSCSMYTWRRPSLVMQAVRNSVDHLHSLEIDGALDCVLANPQPAFDASDFDSAAHPFDAHNEHPIDFWMNVGGSNADDDLSLLASGAAVYGALTGTKSWNVETHGIHCDALKSDAAWLQIRVGAGLP
jgi:hypothetical protein